MLNLQTRPCFCGWRFSKRILPGQRRCYESVLKANPYETAALVNLGAIYAGVGRTEEATKLWERALEANPAIEAAVLNLAQIQPPAAAKTTLQRYLELNPASTSARTRLTAIP